MEKKRKISTVPMYPEITTRIKELDDCELDNNVLIELPSNEKVENWLRTSFPIGSTNAVENYFTFINPESESSHNSVMGKSNIGGGGGGIGGSSGVAVAGVIDEDSSVDTTKYIKSNQTRTRRKRSIKQHCFLSSTTAAAAAAATAATAKSVGLTSNVKITNQNNIQIGNVVGAKPLIKHNGRGVGGGGGGGDKSLIPVMQKMKNCSVELLKSPKLSNGNCRTGADNDIDAAINRNVDNRLSKNIYSVWYIKKKRRTRSKTATTKVNQTIKDRNGRNGGVHRGGGGGSLSSSSCENKHFDTRRLVEQRFSGRLAKKRKNAEKINGGNVLGGGGDNAGAGTGVNGDDEDDINHSCKSNQKFLRSTRRKRNLNDEISKNILRSGL